VLASGFCGDKAYTQPVNFFANYRDKTELLDLLRMMKTGNLTLRDISSDENGYQLLLFDEGK
jgi:hypothetical protein